MLSLKDRLLQAEDDFISSLAAGDGAVSSFADRWELLLHDVNSAMASSCLDSETATLVHTIALRIATYVDASTEVYESYNTLTAELVEQVDHLMSELTLSSKSSTPASMASSQPSSPSSLSSPLYTKVPGQIESAPGNGRKRCRSSSPPRKAPKRKCSSVKHHPPKIDSIYAPSSRPPVLSTLNEPHVPTRKRRLSDADITVSVKPGKRAYLGPRLHAVSDSYLGVHCQDTRTADRIEHIEHSRSRILVDREGSAPLDGLAIPITTFYPGHLPYAKPSGEVELSSMLLGSPSFDESPSPGDDAVDAWLTSLFDSRDSTFELQTPLLPLRDSPSFSWLSCDPSKAEETIALNIPLADTPVEGVEKAINFGDALPWPQITPPPEDIVDWSNVFEYPQPSNSNLLPHLRPRSPGDSSSEPSTDSEDDSPATPTMSSMLSMPLQYADSSVLPICGSSTPIRSHGIEVVNLLSTFHSQSSSSFTIC